MRIDSVAAGPDRAGRYTVTFADGTKLRLYRQTVEDFCLYSGCELSQEEYARLLTAAGQMSARMRAVRIVSAGNVSKSDLQQRLVHKGESATDAQEAVAWMSELELLDDRKTAEQIVERCIRKQYGLNRAKQALYEKRIPKEYWDAVLADYPEQEDGVLSYLQKNLKDPADPKAVRRVTDALVRRGHSYSVIRRALERMRVDEQFLEEC